VQSSRTLEKTHNSDELLDAQILDRTSFLVIYFCSSKVPLNV